MDDHIWQHFMWFAYLPTYDYLWNIIERHVFFLRKQNCNHPYKKVICKAGILYVGPQTMMTVEIFKFAGSRSIWLMTIEPRTVNPNRISKSPTYRIDRSAADIMFITKNGQYRDGRFDNNATKAPSSDLLNHWHEYVYVLSSWFTLIGMLPDPRKVQRNISITLLTVHIPICGIRPVAVSFGHGQRRHLFYDGQLNWSEKDVTDLDDILSILRNFLGQP